MDYTKKTNAKARDCIVKGTNMQTKEVQYFLNVKSVVKAIGCTVSHAYNVLNKVGYYKTAHGWQLEWIDFNKVSVISSKCGIEATEIAEGLKAAEEELQNK